MGLVRDIRELKHAELKAVRACSMRFCNPHVTNFSSNARYATFAHMAGADPTDKRAAAAGLPPIDGINQWPLLSGVTTTPPRTEVALGSCAAAPDIDPFCQTSGNMPTTVNGVVVYLPTASADASAGASADTPPADAASATTSSASTTLWKQENKTLWKLLVGRIPLSSWQAPKYPNNTHHQEEDFLWGDSDILDCGVPPAGTGCLYNLDQVQTVVLLSISTPPNPPRPHLSRVYSPPHLLTF
jgi:hypothetical protein